MKWLVGLLIVAQAPFLLIIFFMAGTDGKVSSQLKIWSVVVPIAMCGIYSLYRVFQPTWPEKLDWPIAAIACAPVLLLAVMLVRNILLG